MNRREDKIKKDLGKRGEELACKFLMDSGHTILERNWRCGHLEIDLITYDSGGIHFVEVKTRTAPVQAAPQESVDLKKQQRIARAASRYLATMDNKSVPRDAECRFDIVAVTFERDKEEIRYFPEAFYPIYL